MKILIVEDDFVARRTLKEILSPYGECDVVVDGEEAIQAFQLAWDERAPYRLICMDIMMPHVDGQESLRRIREIEREMGVKGSDEARVIMISALDDPKTVVDAFYRGGATSYIVKPIQQKKLIEEIRSFGLIR
jgi:two-component system, chemotaxis family, chemotaxis protein CheY